MESDICYLKKKRFVYRTIYGQKYIKHEHYSDLYITYQYDVVYI